MPPSGSDPPDRGQGRIRERQGNRVNNARPHSTLRDLRAHLTQPLALLIFAGIAAILTLIAPFRSDQLPGVIWRFTYWLVIAVLTYTIGTLAHRHSYRWFARHDQPVLRIGIAALITALGANITVLLVDAVMLRHLPALADLPGFVANTSAIAVIIAVILQLLPDKPNAAGSDPPALLARLPLDKRGALVALSVEDHYVRVRTEKGEEILLMRLSDAIRETGDIPGLQVHRSHWAALDQVRSVQRKGDGALLTMTHGPAIPVSRANMAAIREAGLLPR